MKELQKEEKQIQLDVDNTLHLKTQVEKEIDAVCSKGNVTEEKIGG